MRYQMPKIALGRRTLCSIESLEGEPTVPNLPLSGVKIVDFTTLLPGPLATLMLAEAGAEIIKIEPPGGEAMRHTDPRIDGVSVLFALLNAGKKFVCADLKDDEQKSKLIELIDTADALIEQFRPGAMDRLGLGYETLSARNQSLVYCSISGYGQTGPMAGRAGHDLNYMGESGVLSLNPGPSGAPQLPPILAADIAGGTYPAVVNILLALMRRAQTGEGVHLDVAMSENLLPFAFWSLAEGAAGKPWPEPGDHKFSGGLARYQLYTAADGGIVAVAALEEKFWSAFCEAIDLPKALQDDGADRQASIAGVGRIIAGNDTIHWRKVFAGVDCCASVVNSMEQALVSQHFAERGIFDFQIAGEGLDPLAALPLAISTRFRRQSGKPRTVAAPGADNQLLERSEH